MDKTLLLRAAERIVGGVEIGDEYSLEPFQKFLDEAAFSRIRVKITYLVEVRKDPHICSPASEAYSRLINVKKTPIDEVIQNDSVCFLIASGGIIL